jgi:hypothetical protein
MRSSYLVSASKRNAPQQLLSWASALQITAPSSGRFPHLNSPVCVYACVHVYPQCLRASMHMRTCAPHIWNCGHLTARRSSLYSSLLNFSSRGDYFLDAHMTTGVSTQPPPAPAPAPPPAPPPTTHCHSSASPRPPPPPYTPLSPISSPVFEPRFPVHAMLRYSRVKCVTSAADRRSRRR